MNEPTRSRAGNRQRLPENALSVCASCSTRRGTKRTGWEPITRAEQVVGWTCPDCPTHAEPIRRESTASGVRFNAVVTGTPGPGGKRRQIRHRFWSLDDAREWVTDTRAAVAAETSIGQGNTDPSRMTVRVVAEKWLQMRREDRVRPIREVTLNGYASALDAVLRQMGDRIARDVTTDDVETMLHALATTGGKWGRGLSHRSIVYSLVTIRQVFAYAVRKGWTKVNPAAAVKPPADRSTVKRRTGVWSASELARFRDQADIYGDGTRFAAEPWLRAGMRLTLCGLRRSEVLGLDWRNVDLGVGSVEVAESRVKTGRGKATASGQTKSAASHRVVGVEAVHPGTVAALRTLWIAQGQPEAGLVILDAAGEPVEPDAYSRRFRTLTGEAGVLDLGSIHNVRHTIATVLHEAGHVPANVARLLGHEVTLHLATYVKSTDTGQADVEAGAGRLFAV